MIRFLALLACLTVSVPALRSQDESEEAKFSPDQLDNLLAPVALYPDPLLAQLLVAATYLDDVDAAARFLRGDSDPFDIDSQPWDVSVKAVAHYPDVLSMMADSLDWTAALGQAYAEQPEDVMASIQRLRAQARAVGNLESGPQQEVVDDTGNIEIWPTQPDSITVPQYDPDVAYFGSGGAYSVVVFTVTYPIGAWLNCDFDWHHRRIFYHGWKTGPGWVGRSLPYVRMDPVYVHLPGVAYGHSAGRGKINYPALNRYDSVHTNATFTRGAPAGHAPSGNQVIQRNIDTSDPRLDAFRGNERLPIRTSGPEMRVPAPAYQVQAPRMDSQPNRQEPPVQVQRQPQPERSTPAAPVRERSQPDPVAHQPEQVVHQPEPIVHQPAPDRRPPEQVFQQPVKERPPEAVRPVAEPRHNEAFGGDRGPFDAQAASQRGQASRSEAAQPASSRANAQTPQGK